MKNMRRLLGRRKSPSRPAAVAAEPGGRAIAMRGRPEHSDGPLTLWFAAGAPPEILADLDGPRLRALPVEEADRPGIVIADTVTMARADSGFWLWVAAPDTIDHGRLADERCELILTPNERTRTAVEQAAPQMIGNTWVLTDEMLPRIVERYYPERRGPQRLGVIGYNLKFLRPILANLLRSGGTSALVDEWRTFAADPTSATDQVIAESGVVLCEWCGKNTAYASRNKRPGQRLITRLHRWELQTDHWRDIDIDAVDAVITVGDHYRRLVVEKTGWPPEKVLTISNQVDDLQLARSKTDDARFTLGMLGASSSRKRLDLALDLITELHSRDDRFRLRIKTTLPQDEKWVWDDPREREYFEQQLARLDTAPLRDIVTLDPFGPDVASWFRSVGFIISVSDDESFHLGPAEGMASGAIPAIRNWPGATTIYPETFVHDDLQSMSNDLLSYADDVAKWRGAGAAVREHAARAFGLDGIVDSWAAVLRT